MSVVGNACDTAIIPGCGDGAGTVSSMAVFFPHTDFITVRNEVPAIYIIYIAVSIVVNAITGNLVLIDPDGVFQVGVCSVNTGINNSYCDSPFIFCFTVGLPGIFNVDINIFYSIGVDRFKVVRT